MNSTALEILSYIPQRPPFVMVDRIVYSGEKTTRSLFKITSDNIFVEGGILKEPGLVENIAQTAAARAGYIAREENKPVRLGFIGGIRNLEIFGYPEVNSEIETEITIENQIFDVSVISGKITSNDSIIATCEMKIFIINQ